jgi:hypothetical protein
MFNYCKPRPVVGYITEAFQCHRWKRPVSAGQRSPVALDARWLTWCILSENTAAWLTGQPGDLVSMLTNTWIDTIEAILCFKDAIK